MSVFQYLLDGQQKSRKSEVFYTQMFYSKKSQFFRLGKTNYPNNQKKSRKKMEYFMNTKTIVQNIEIFEKK